MLHAHLSPSVPATFRPNGSSVKTIRKHTLDHLRNETLARVSSSAQKVRPPLRLCTQVVKIGEIGRLWSEKSLLRFGTYPIYYNY